MRVNLSSFSKVSGREYAAEHVCTTAARTTFLVMLLVRFTQRLAVRVNVSQTSGIGVSDETSAGRTDRVT